MSRDIGGEQQQVPSLLELSRRLDHVETELALLRLAQDYCIGADQRDAARWRSVWTEHAVWQVNSDLAYRGVEEIEAAVAAQWRTFPVMQHACVNHTVESVAGDDAAGRCDVVLMVKLPDGEWIVGGGVYLDRYRREDGRWRIVERRVERPFDLPPLHASAQDAAAPSPSD